jgi:hypothetical protein
MLGLPKNGLLSAFRLSGARAFLMGMGQIINHFLKK